MKKILLILSIVTCFGCKNTGQTSPMAPAEDAASPILGTWKLIYGEITTEDSTEVKDLSNTTFIKIFNEDHFAFFNQNEKTAEGFYGGGGTYVFDGRTHTEKLDYSAIKEIRGKEFVFEVEFNGDTLIQKGLEDVPEIGLKHYIKEKYIKID